MRTKLKHLLIYHPHLDCTSTIDLLVSFEQGNLNKIKQSNLNKYNVNNSIGVCGFLPLELAIIYDHKDIFDYLVYDLNANLNVKNKSFESMPFVAMAFQRRDYLFDLLNMDTSTLYDCTSKSKRTLIHKVYIIFLFIFFYFIFNFFFVYARPLFTMI
jgi:ankyrin repeat protein